MKLLFFSFVFFVPLSGLAQQVSGSNCSFTSKPDELLSRELHARQKVAGNVSQLAAIVRQTSSSATVSASTLSHRNFIDDIVLSQLSTARIPAAGLTSDEEFLRRITLDLTGRIPSSADIRSFVADTSAGKRDAVIEKLLYSTEFVDKWTVWLGDLLGNVSSAQNVQTGTAGRDAYYNYFRIAIDGNISFRDIAYEAITAVGDTADGANGGPSNYIYHQTTPMGPVQDSYDTTLAKTASTFMGITYYDCLLCHNGAGHMEGISLWGSTVTRTQAEQMAAFFSRLNFNMPRTSPVQTDAMFNSWRVLDKTSGSYDLNTNYGNRPNRIALGTLKTLTPVYRNGSTPAEGQNWRDAFAKQMSSDPMFAYNFANRMWKAFFNLGLVDPVDVLDPARLDPQNPPPAGWELQAANPVLLARLAQEAVFRNFQFRDYMRVMVQSTTYQLSSRYDALWDISYIPMYARHYPRRLDAEEVHDAIAKATGVLGNYNVNGPTAPLLQWAMQLPDPLAPAGSGANLLNVFLRGNRDTAPRSSDASIVQRLTLMNDGFVTTRVKMAASPQLQAVAKLTDNNSVVEEMFLSFVSRMPTADERSKSLKFLSAATTTTLRNSALEDLAWALINKIDFLYSY